MLQLADSSEIWKNKNLNVAIKKVTYEKEVERRERLYSTEET
jgi:hypothetical protein